MNRAEQTKQTLTQLYGQSDSPLAGTDPEFAAIKTRLIYGEVYAEEKLSAKLRELLTFAVLSAQGGCEPQVKAHVGGNAAVGNGKETLLAALTLCMPYIGFPRTLNALDLGINFFDTANGYSAGTSEEYLGRALKKNVSRDKAVIASKVYFNPGRLSRQAIHREIDGSLKRLGTDYLDLYIIHRFDYDTPMEEPYRPHRGGHRPQPAPGGHAAGREEVIENSGLSSG